MNLRAGAQQRRHRGVEVLGVWVRAIVATIGDEDDVLLAAVGSGAEDGGTVDEDAVVRAGALLRGVLDLREEAIDDRVGALDVIDHVAVYAVEAGIGGGTVRQKLERQTCGLVEVANADLHGLVEVVRQVGDLRQPRGQVVGRRSTRLVRVALESGIRGAIRVRAKNRGTIRVEDEHIVRVACRRTGLDQLTSRDRTEGCLELADTGGVARCLSACAEVAEHAVAAVRVGGAFDVRRGIDNRAVARRLSQRRKIHAGRVEVFRHLHLEPRKLAALPDGQRRRGGCHGELDADTRLVAHATGSFKGECTGRVDLAQLCRVRGDVDRWLATGQRHEAKRHRGYRGGHCRCAPSARPNTLSQHVNYSRCAGLGTSPDHRRRMRALTPYPTAPPFSTAISSRAAKPHGRAF